MNTTTQAAAPSENAAMTAPAARAADTRRGVVDGSSPRHRYVSDYAELSSRVRAAGLLRRRPRFYIVRAATLALLLAGCAGAVVVIGDSWWQLLVAALRVVLVAYWDLFAQEAPLRLILASGKPNYRLALIIGDLVAGMSHGWWMSKHSRHHANPNKLDADPDIEPGALVFTSDVSVARRWRRGFAGWFVARQGTLFFPLLLLAGLNLHISGIRTVFGRRPVKYRKFEIPMLLLRLTLYPVALFMLLSPGVAAAFLCVQLAVFGFAMGATFAPNHKGMPLVPRGLSIDYVRRQVLTSRNVRGGWFIDVAMGGLNYQIEHHLFPSMPRPSLKHAQPIVRQFCSERAIPYAETSLLESWGIVVRHLNQVGLGEADPFACPLAAQLRSTS
jgi:fatty acid desaturase